MTTYAFANILLSGTCNRRCPHCIGQQVAPGLRVANLDRFPLAGLSRFCDLLARHAVTQVSLTGIDTDPLLYHHQERLLDHLRETVPRVRVSLHTNGALALDRIGIFNRYDRASVSLASFDAETCRAMTGSPSVLDLARILDAATIPIKVSVLVTEHNLAEIPEILARCTELGVPRLVLRRLYGDTRRWPLLAGHRAVARFGGNPVYRLDGMEVTLWSFTDSSLGCLNLFPDGSISDRYELVGTR